ncbi:hypothetical protein H4R34_000262 [Dimargaris verticillata]|uniref:tRNA-uridine aminocarboxypropyltransferase 1 n=1 Tax=Dimargaris verticillata TaxID=2761393 RepID=A0A9W8B7G1_9FUNG|nr:hypothetical protein H4R34_000262 [Dimargaris verticillata]
MPADSYSLEDLQTKPSPILDACITRQPCPQCHKPVKYFCYRCYTVVNVEPSVIPEVTLPVSLTILKHPKEKDGKSTAVHAKIIAPRYTQILDFPSKDSTLPDPGRSVLLFPGPDSCRLANMDPTTFDTVVVIDGTWSQARAMVKYSPVLNQMRKVTLLPRQTRFWRYQQCDESYMATIEAIYFFYREYYEAYAGSKRNDCSKCSMVSVYDGRYDDLLFYYKYFYDHIQKLYRTNPHLRFTPRQKEGYIDYKANPSAQTTKDI